MMNAIFHHGSDIEQSHYVSVEKKDWSWWCAN